MSDDTEGICGDMSPAWAGNIPQPCILRYGHKSEWHEAEHEFGSPMRWKGTWHPAAAPSPSLSVLGVPVEPDGQ